LNITEGVPVGEGKYATLVNSRGLMHGKEGLRALHAQGNINLSEVLLT